METFQYTITDEIGIHARPAGELAKLAKEFQSKITIKTETKQLIIIEAISVSIFFWR